MSYRQSWESGQAHVTKLRHAADNERSFRAATRTPIRFRSAVAASVRSVAERLGRFADRLDRRSAHPTRFAPSRPDGA